MKNAKCTSVAIFLLLLLLTGADLQSADRPNSSVQRKSSQKTQATVGETTVRATHDTDTQFVGLFPAPLPFVDRKAGTKSIPGPLASQGKLLADDDFERDSIAPWKQIIASIKVDDGKLVQTPGRADHGSVGRLELPMKNVIVSFKFSMHDSKGFSACFNDRSYKGSHVGHICRVTFRGDTATLSDGKEGTFNNKIFAMKKDKSKKKEVAKLLKGRQKSVKFEFKPKQWYQTTIEIFGDEMRLSIDGNAVGYLKSSGFAHPTKENFSFASGCKKMRYDDIKIWEAVKK